jgi:glycosyltransferase involved in cell wall biosynthesis
LHTPLPSPDIDIVLPYYNPAQGWAGEVISRMEMLCASLPGYRVRAILVNDGSDYQSTHASVSALEAQLTDALFLTYPHNMGKGFAIRTGVQRCVAPVIVYTDIDFPYTIASMLRVITPVLSGEADVAIAVRNETYYAQLPAFRRWMSKCLRWVNRKVLGLKTSDTQGGLKAFSSEMRELFLQTRINRYLFDLEFVHLISKDPDIRLRTVEADLREGITMSPARMRILLGEGWNFLKVWLGR